MWLDGAMVENDCAAIQSGDGIIQNGAVVQSLPNSGAGLPNNGRCRDTNKNGAVLYIMTKHVRCRL